VSLVDLRPTLLETVDLRDPRRSSGRSIRAALSAGEIAARACFSATDDPLLQFDWSPQRSLTTESWKYIRSPEPELYDLASDPRETNNVASARAEQVQALENQLASLEQEMTIRQGAAVELSPQEKRTLVSLGYLGGHGPVPQPGTSGTQLPDVKRMLPLYNQVETANRLRIAGDAPAAEMSLRALIVEAPDYLPAQLKLALVLAQQQKFVESRAVLEGVLERDPASSEAYFQRGALGAAQLRFAEAIDDYHKSLEREPRNRAVVLFSLGQALVQLGRLRDAEETFRQLLADDPLYIDARLAWANMLAVEESRAADAEEHYREVLRYNSSSAEAHGNLAILLAGQNRLPEAEAHFARAVELSPKSAELRCQYGTLLLVEGRRDEGIGALEEALRLDPQHAQARARLETARKRRAP
jgi:tetratricopeptide (TPR) repeat protein